MSDPARTGVVLVAPAAAWLGVYERREPGRLRTHARRRVALPPADWPVTREALRRLVALARARRCARVTVVVRASVAASRRRQVIAEAGRLRCHALEPTPGEELRWLFLGAVREGRAADGLVAEVERSGLALARWRGRVLASTARLRLTDSVGSSGIGPGRPGEALVVAGGLVSQLLATPSGARSPRAALLARAAVARQARSRGGAGPAALALRRLMDWMGRDSARLSPDALADGLAAALLRAPIPPE